MKTKIVEEHLQHNANSIVNFDSSDTNEYKNRIAPNGDPFVSIGFLFREHEVDELLLRWDLWFKSFLVVKRDCRSEGHKTKGLGECTEMTLYWRQFPTIASKPNYPGHYKVDARVMIGPMNYVNSSFTNEEFPAPGGIIR